MGKIGQRRVQLNSVREYFDPSTPASYSGISTFKKTNNISKELNDLQEYPAYTLHKPVKRRFRRNKVIVSSIDSQWQVDLTDLSSLSSYNDGYRYLLFCIDVLSKYLWVQPMKQKNQTETVKAFNDIFYSTDRRPYTIHSDQGSEFINSKMQRLLKKMHIDFFTTYNYETKASICERVQRTIKGRMYRYFTHHNTNRYIDVLPMIVQSYNNTWHRSIRRTPASVNELNAQDVWDTLYRHTVTSKDALKDPIYKFTVGDIVRVAQHKAQFRKGYMSSWSIELFKVRELVRRRIPMYKLVDLADEFIKGSFYGDEIQRVQWRDDLFIVDKVIRTKTTRGRKHYLVSWLGYPPKFNSWVTDLKKI